MIKALPVQIESIWHNNWTIVPCSVYLRLLDEHEPKKLGWRIEHMHCPDPDRREVYQKSSCFLFPAELEEEHTCRYCRERISPIEIKKLILLNRP